METDGVFYFANIPSDETFHWNRRRQLHNFKARHHQLQFQGCLSNIKINDRPTPFDQLSSNVHVKICYEHEESGIFLNGQKELRLGKTEMILVDDK